MNWSEYNKNLVKRGNINLWLPENIATWWYIKTSEGRGRPFIYSDRAIETCLTIGYLFNMPLRMTEGFLNSFFDREELSIKASCYTQLSRRAAPEIQAMRGQKLNLAFDSTGLKVFGEGEWKVRTHGASKRRVWRKLHLALNVKTLCITGVSLTKNSVDDAKVAAEMLIKKFDGCVEKVFGNGTYDKGKVYKAATRIGANLITPPAHNAQQQNKLIDPSKLPRDHAIARIRILGNDQNARQQWKKEIGYHKRSLTETTMYRF